MAPSPLGLPSRTATGRVGTWFPNLRAAGIAGILAAAVPAGELVFFAVSSFAPTTFVDPTTAPGIPAQRQ